MNRRNFIQRTGLLGLSSLLSAPHLSWASNSKFKMGYQLYSVNDEMKKDPILVLKALKAIGYEDLEIFGFNSAQNSIYGYKPSQFKSILNDLGMTASSGHYGFSSYLHKSSDELLHFVDQCIAAAHDMGSRYITWPWIAPPQRTIDNFKHMAKLLNIIGERVNAAGLGFAYHNHGFEFEDHNGQNGFDIILNETDPALVKLQMDMYWVMRSSTMTPKQLIAQQPGRYVMWHIKDMDAVTEDYAELGQGVIDYTKLLPDPIQSGLEFYFLEQGGNFANNSIQSAATSAKYFKQYLQTYL
ncbi:TIM barrel protein [Alteromonadaceae bacterium BrNp21-10]|nr:TIM barrel protein [Alteromonadaceae bacterium BrNp21-10]